ncbi:S9 family peptidase [Ferruginibacter sp. HRS2-29]|uniref:alpha/beta hydrolase family protein n=1 Tax=Ferruginibacter sp. HRS2-29 TaxID=2487334 RepID=UPI0020CD9DB8|nr:alpha/beta fold hydrolase [Ferruginibacter sp. HRS2-29]
MKLLIPLFLFLYSANSFAQQTKFTGTWEGKINVGISLRLVFEFNEDKKGVLSGILRSPDQSPKPLPADTTYTRGDSIFVAAKMFNISFSGKLTNDTTINGTFVQGGPIPLVLTKVPVFVATKRPQTPAAPFNYNTREVEYYNSDRSVKFSGTLTSPAIEPGTNYIKPPNYPTILLITGSGPQNRDEEMFLHKPFAVIADYLTRKGFAVLRVDDRGVGKTSGNFQGATSADFAKDVEAGIDFLKTQGEVDSTRIGLLGHSEGGMIAPIVASRRKDVKFIVLLAGPGVPITTLMSEQFYAVSKSNGGDETISKLGSRLFEQAVMAVHSSKDTNVMRKKIVELLAKDYSFNKKLYDSLELNTDALRNAYASGRIKSMLESWYYYFSGFDPTPYLTKLSCDVLALNGEKDVQVLPRSNLEGIKAALKKSKSKNYEVKEIPGLNHLFQTCKKCSPQEYGELEETFSPVALEIMGEWLKSQGGL